MCGIVGYITLKPQFDEDARFKFLSEALVMDTLRGWDSTGVMWGKPGPRGKVWTMKSVEAGPDFVRSPEYHKAKPDGWFAVGHNRAATHGTVKHANAHPFTHGPITLVHNGTVANWKSLPKTSSEIEVDSSMIALNLSEVGPNQVDDVLKKINGSYALVWYDSRDKSLNAVRNGSRPLHFGLSKNREVLFFMSEAGMLRAVTERLRNTQLHIASVHLLETYKHLKWKQGSLVPEVSSTSPFQHPPVQRPAYQYGPYSGKSGAAWKDDGKWENLPQYQNSKESAANGCATQKSSSTECGTDDMVVETTLRAHMHVGSRMKSMLATAFELNDSIRTGFHPTEFIPWGNGLGMVRGNLLHPAWGYTEWDAVIYDFPEKWVTGYHKDRMDRPWTVQPIGLAPNWYGLSKDTVPAIRCAIRLFKWELPEDAVVSPGAPQSEQEQREDMKAEPHTHVGTELFYGPGGTLIFREQLMSLFQYGCQECGGNISEKEHERVLWVGEPAQPICPSCANTMTDPKAESKALMIVH